MTDRIDTHAPRQAGEQRGLLDFDGPNDTAPHRSRAATRAHDEPAAASDGDDAGRSAPSIIRGTVSSHVIRVMLEAAEQVGVAEHEVAMIGGLRRELLDDDRLRVPSIAMVRLWKLMYAAGGPGVGIRAADVAQSGRLHVWDYLIAAAPTLAEGLGDAARFSAAMADPADHFIVVDDDPHLSVVYRSAPHGDIVSAAVNEFTLGVLMHRARAVRGAAADPVRVEFSHRAPRSHGYLADVFGTSNIQFDQEYSSFTMLNVERAQNRQSYDPELRRILHLYAQSIIDTAQPALTWKETLHAAISDVLADSRSDADLEAVARRLAVSPRTLQRRLAERDTSWRRELEAVRYQHATLLLRGTRLPLRSIAERIGYNDHRALVRAVRRWTGQTPDAYRRTHLPDIEV
ncbi:helix-turn-helix transcriptional regulator [Nocardia sp. NBC_01327]|uniref:helix-turn-helix transcriptional regulator n=1 Tax=Nocardia sp. NBC_01327 TaxID=2903593 RepID=UPI002E143671|nr:AraC family transcriptional regulator [Nocardia sp. NBC_01327]